MGRYAVIVSIGMIEEALRKVGWVQDRPRNNLGRYRAVYTKDGRQLALVAGHNGAVAIFEWSESMGWTRAYVGYHDEVLKWVEREAR
jgi:hypothetical protein|nr:MAG TPA: hypothetical protein [Caudoviricetes sp.]